MSYLVWIVEESTWNADRTEIGGDLLKEGASSSVLSLSVIGKVIKQENLYISRRCL
jgi:hypothetical protein